MTLCKANKAPPALPGARHLWKCQIQPRRDSAPFGLPLGATRGTSHFLFFSFFPLKALNLPPCRLRNEGSGEKKEAKSLLLCFWGLLSQVTQSLRPDRGIGVSGDPKRRTWLGETQGGTVTAPKWSCQKSDPGNLVPEPACLEREGMRGGVSSPLPCLMAVAAP